MADIKLGNKKDKDLKNIRDLTLEMFDEVKKMSEMSKDLLKSNDNELAVQIIEEDENVDTLQNDIIVEINNFIVIHQPNTRDLREVLGAYQLISDLERIGDYFKSFAKTLIKSTIEERKQQKLVEKTLYEIDIRILETKEAYKTVNHTLAKMVAKRDSEIDKLTQDLIKETNKKLSQTNDINEVKVYTKIILIAKNLERSGEHLVNICEQISYISKGQLYHYS